MKNEWIIDVLMDLRKFSASNDLPRLAEGLDDVIVLATCELSTSENNKRQAVRQVEQTVGHAGGIVASDNS